MRKIIIFGARGNGTVLTSLIESINEVKKDWEILGFINDTNEDKINDYPVLGKILDNTHSKYLKNNDVYFCWTFFSSSLKKYSYIKLNDLNIPQKKFAQIIHPQSNVPKKTLLGHGVVINAFVNISSNVKIGNHVQIHSNSTIGHDTEINDCAFLSMGSSVGSFVKLGKCCFLGNNSCIREKVVVGDWSTVGMGSVVIKDVKKKTIVAGNPAKKLL